MGKPDRKTEILQVTMRIISESGLDTFSMKKVTERMGVAESLLYKYYPTKEIQLYSAFESVHEEIGSLFDDVEIPTVSNKEEILEYAYTLWKRYFLFLVDNDYKTLFYFAYRDSSYMRNIGRLDEELRLTYFRSFVSFVYAVENVLHVNVKISSTILWTYLLDASGTFAKRVIRKDIQLNEDTVQQLWQLCAYGLSGLIQEEK